MTTVYNDYYQAYDDSTIDITNVDLTAMLVSSGYTPNPAHKIADVSEILMSIPHSLVGDDIVKLGMTEIVDKCVAIFKNNSVDKLNDLPADDQFVILFDPYLQILCFCEKLDKITINNVV
jgi:hypothetical protein